MKKVRELTTGEKELLTALGNHPDTPTKELLPLTSYKRLSTVVRKIDQLKKRKILFGPWYTVDHGRLCKNPLTFIMCTLESNHSVENIVPYLKLMDTFVWMYAALSSHKTVLLAEFLSSDDAQTIQLLQLLKDHDIITDYIARVRHVNDVQVNPNFFGDYNPSLENLLDPCDVPDFSFGQHDTNWNECDITTLSYLQHIFKGSKLIDILREERKLHKSWTYDQIHYSYKKMLKNGLIKRTYYAPPFLSEHIVHFILYFKTEDIKLTKRMLCNFARGARVFKDYTIFDDWGFIMCASHNAFLANLMYKLDALEEITAKELYHLRSLRGDYIFIRATELKYFDVETQTLQYPYHEYERRICEKIEEVKG